MAKPAFIAYTIKGPEGKKGFWTKIGAAFAHKNGGGYDIVLDALPLDGRITLREPTADDEDA